MAGFEPAFVVAHQCRRDVVKRNVTLLQEVLKGMQGGPVVAGGTVSALLPGLFNLLFGVLGKGGFQGAFFLGYSGMMRLVAVDMYMKLDIKVNSKHSSNQKKELPKGNSFLLIIISLV